MIVSGYVCNKTRRTFEEQHAEPPQLDPKDITEEMDPEPNKKTEGEEKVDWFVCSICICGFSYPLGK